MRVVAIPDLERCADAVDEMAVTQPFPARVVLVPSEPHAHALRVELVRRAPAALIGTRFLTAAAAARTVLDAAEVSYRVGEEDRRRLRVRKLLRAGLPLATYRAHELDSPGWEDAFAATIEQLEAAGLRPADIEGGAEPRLADLAAVWRALDRDAGPSWTVHRILREASEVLEARPHEWPYAAPVLALVHAWLDPAHARFVRAIPDLTLGIVPCRSAQQQAYDRVRGLLGEEVAAHVLAPVVSARTNELGLLVEQVFAQPEARASAVPRRSAGPDGSVSLEVHAGVDEELDATIRWVAEQVVGHGTPLQEIAILVPRPEPLAFLIADRIEAMAWPPGARPVYVASGRPATSIPAGARLIAVVRVLQEFLAADALCELLPRLRLHGAEGHLSPRQARRVIEMLGVLGGSAARPYDAMCWRERLPRLDTDERLRGIAAALAALVALAECVLMAA